MFDKLFSKLIVIEGPDKVGKATQAKYLEDYLKRSGYDVVRLEVPFNDKLTYKLIYKMLGNGAAKTYPNIFQLIQFFNKLFFQCTLLLWYMYTNDFVILDRWSLSSVIYGEASGANKLFVRFLYLLLKKANITVVILGQTFERKEEGDDSYESDTTLQQNVRKGYYNWVSTHAIDHVIISNTGNRLITHANIVSTLNWLGVTQEYDFRTHWWNPDKKQWDRK